MADNQNTISESEAQQLRDRLAEYDRQKAAEAAKKRQALYDALKPIVASEAYSELLAKMQDAVANNPDDGFFSVHVSALNTIMPNLATQVNQFVPLTATPTPVVSPAVEENGS